MNDAHVLTFGILSVLLLGSAIGHVLKISVANRQPHVVIDNVLLRVKSWWGIAALVGLAFWLGSGGIYLLFCLASFQALREFVPASPTSGWQAVLRGCALILMVPAHYLMLWLDNNLWLVLAPLCGLLILPRFAMLSWGLVLCVMGLSFAPALLALAIPGHAGREGFLLMFLLLVTQLGDVFQYVFGKLFGKHLLAPRVSPSKTMEGLLGGAASATALGAGLAWMTPFDVREAALLALAVSLLGVLGGLVFSSVKRARGIKDWGAVIPGHGGVLDRLDSLCLSAPVFYLIVRTGWGV